MKFLPAMCLLLLLSCAQAQANENFAIPHASGWGATWRCDGGPHAYNYVLPLTGVIEVVGDSPKPFTHNHRMCEYQVSDGASYAQAEFGFGQALKKSYIDAHANHVEDITRDCLNNTNQYACLVGNELFCVFVDRLGPEWKAACAGDFWLTLGLQIPPVPDPGHYIQTGILQRTSDGVIHLLDYKTILGDFPLDRPIKDGDYPQLLSVFSGGGLIIANYQMYDGTVYKTEASAIPDIGGIGRAGVMAIVMHRHLCTRFPASREFDVKFFMTN